MAATSRNKKISIISQFFLYHTFLTKKNNDNFAIVSPEHIASMKKKILLIIAIVSAIVANAANIEKRYTKLIEKYDVPIEARCLEDSTPAAFWRDIVDYNEMYLKFLRDMEKNKGAEKEALRMTAELPRFYSRYDESIVEGMQGYCDSLLTDMGIPYRDNNCRLYVVYADEADAFTALTDDGFAMCVTSGLISRKGLTRDILMGLVANQYVHGILKDHCRSFYQAAKQDRKDALLAGALTVGVVGLATAAVALDPHPYDYGWIGNDVTVINNVNIKNEIPFPTSKFFFKYTPGLEYEADLTAFRFMQYLGKGEDYINGLKILGSSSYDSQFGENTDQPTITQRIALLEFAESHPDIYNTLNADLKQKRLSKERY